MGLDILKILKTLWLMCFLGVVSITAIFGLWIGEFTQLYFQMLFILSFGFLPFTLLYRYISINLRAYLLFVNVCFITAALSFLLPFLNHILVLFLPLIAILFNKRRLFYIACFFTILSGVYANFFQYEHESGVLQAIIEITYIFCYLIVLDVVVKYTIKQSKMTYIFDKTLKTLTLAVEAKDEYTRGHSIRVSDYSMIIGRYLEEIGHKVDLETLRISSLLHDIGKINIPQNILSKEGKLTNEEYNLIKMHSEHGADLAKELDYPEHIVKDILYHHERFDGTGYPKGIHGHDIPLNSRIVAVADTFDALTSNRSYRKAFTAEDARKIVIDNMGSQFDPAFESIFKAVYPALATYQGGINPEKEGIPSKNVS